MVRGTNDEEPGQYGAGQMVEGAKGELEHFEGEVTADGRRV